MFKSKWDLWLENQNKVTQEYFRAQMKESDKLIWLGFGLGIPVGMLLTILIWTSL